MTAPLYQGHDKPKKCDSNGHQGLWFERFFDQYNNHQQQWDVLKPTTHNAAMGNAHWLLTHFNNKKVGDKAELHRHSTAQTQLAQSLQGQSHTYQASGHFVTGMGNAHPVENGFAWHPTLGVPYLTGAAVKGIVRSYVENYLDEPAENRQKLLIEWFGSDHKDPLKQINDSQAGNLIFFDAIPTQPVTLGIDIMTPHMGKWYEKGGSDAAVGKPEAVPADWHDPVPVLFLVAKAIILQFSYALRHPTQNIELDDVQDVLTRALEHTGAGGKTATGYGEMQPHDGRTARDSTQRTDEQWEKATFQYNKGSGEIKATGNKKSASIKGENANKLLEKLSKKQRADLEKNKLVATAVVHSLGNQHELLDIT